MSWEDGLNEVTIATQVAYAAGTNEVAATTLERQRAEAEVREFNERYRGDAAPAIGRGPFNRCGRDNHYFECKHELRCECGLTERLPLNTQEGL